MRVTVLGTGLLGEAIGMRLLQQSHQLTVWNRTKSKTRALAAAGAKMAASAGAAVAAAEVVVAVLQDGAVTRHVLFDLAADTEWAGRTLVQMGTISGAESLEFAADVNSRGGGYLEAPVLGSSPEAEAGELLIMIGGDEKVEASVRPLLEDLGRLVVKVGRVDQAATLKLALNQILVSQVASFALSLGMVRDAGIPIDAFMQILELSFIRSPQFSKKLPRMLQRDFSDPHFPVSHMAKDVALILEEAGRRHLGAAHLQGIAELIEQAMAQGYVDVDYSALYNAVDPPGRPHEGP